MNAFPPGFLWGSATAAHQTEGNNLNTDWWVREGMMPGMESSGDACDSYHRYDQDMRLLAEAGLDTYRFSIEWARIVPREGQVSRALLAHYRRMIDTALAFGLTPVVTLLHSTIPLWLAERGGWQADDAVERFVDYVRVAATILADVPYVITLNEPNMMAQMVAAIEAARSGGQWRSATLAGQAEAAASATADEVREAVRNLPTPTAEHGQVFIAAHHAARAVLRELLPAARVGWTIANPALYAAPEHENRLREVRYGMEDVYLEAAAGDDFIGVQAYSAQEVGADGLVPHPPHPTNTLTGAAYRPDALEMAVRHTWAMTGLPILVTENGIATGDDELRIAYTREALRGLVAAMDDGADVRGYLHWSLLDNFEWGHWEPTFGLIAVDRSTFVRTPKPSLAWLGAVARGNGAELGQP
ncbi:MAG: family 1 glycosylhydrolase [Promicromonosporaceae bacterium]|nr:family 1 glycosylhydrolase [Promicromonosporaceae bacterium]